jgi:hypothetical protein
MLCFRSFLPNVISQFIVAQEWEPSGSIFAKNATEDGPIGYSLLMAECEEGLVTVSSPLNPKLV